MLNTNSIVSREKPIIQIKFLPFGSFFDPPLSLFWTTLAASLEMVAQSTSGPIPFWVTLPWG